MTIKLWHCKDTRSLRPLWTLEEIGIAYDINVMPFPPRVLQRDFLNINLLGTVPYFVDDNTHMTESTAICHYLAEKYQASTLSIQKDHPEYGDFLNWLYHSDATLTFPQSLVLRYSQLEPEQRKQPQVVEDYRKWYLARLRKLDQHIASRQYLCDERFTIADIAVGYALYLGEKLTISDNYADHTKAYLKRLKSRPGFIRAIAKT